MKISGSKQYKCLRICTTYISTGRTMQSLADQYKCSKSTIWRYLREYAYEIVDYDMYKAVEDRIKQNKREVYEWGQSINRYSSQLGDMD